MRSRAAALLHHLGGLRMKRPSNSGELPRWDLTDLFHGAEDPQLERALEDLERDAGAFAERYRNQLAAQAERLGSAIADYERILDAKARIEAYARLLSFEEADDPRHAAVLARVEQRCAAVALELAFVERELGEVDPEGPQAWLRGPRRGSYLALCRRSLRFRDHRLSDVQERRLTRRRQIRRALSQQLRRGLSLTRYRVPAGSGERSLSFNEAFAELYSPHPDVRRAASQALSDGLDALAPLATRAFNSALEDMHLECAWRGLADPSEHRHLMNDVEPQCIDALCNAVVAHYDIVREYYAFKRSVLGCEALGACDRWAPVTGDELRFKFEEARQIVVEAFSLVSPALADAGRRFFDSRWIDAAPGAGKSVCGFCDPVCGSAHPYVSVGYDESLRQLCVLAHELGHGVHACMMAEGGHLNLEVAAPVAEIPSTFSELLILDALARWLGAPRGRFVACCATLEQVLLTVFRQVSIHLFERDLHDAFRNEAELSTARINALWRRRQDELYGDSLVPTQGCDSWWCYLTSIVDEPFYSYSFAYGQLISLRLQALFETEPGGFFEKYSRLLRAGASASPAVILVPFGLDVKDPDTWSAAMGRIRRLLDEAKRMHRLLEPDKP